MPRTVESAADRLDGFVRRAARASGGPSPWLVVGVALVAGYTIARVIDWRSHAHPRY